ncbi:MAG TPA: lipase secretion chaperone [Smithella sp.]|nr:lipase secretion chaperone [Smithella sp.]
MNKRKIIADAGLVIVIVIVVIVAIKMQTGKIHEGYVFDRNSGVTAKDVIKFINTADFSPEKVKDYFKNDPINAYTLKYFFFLDDKFKDSRNMEELLQRVHDYLYADMPTHEMADKLFEVYKTYAYYNKGLHDETRSWGTPSTAAEAVEYLHRIQDYRRKVFGGETADALFGPSLKSEEYLIRRGSIASDAGKYGAEKEKIIASLKKDMWGDDADSVDAVSEPLNRYYEKLQIYQKDLAEMGSDEERKARDREFRKEFFSQDQLNRLDEVDRVIADNKKREEDYYAQEGAINDDPALDSNEKSKRITELQNNMFGEEADAFRRRLIIDKAVQPAPGK